MRSSLREGHRERDSVFDVGPYRGFPGGADSRRRWIHHSSEGIFQIGVQHREAYGGDFISDEVQTAWGRTGHKWFGIEHWEVEPDMITAAKGLGNGVPIGLTVAKPEIADSFQGLTISTFGGNPVTSVTAKAVIDIIEEDDLRTNAAVVGGLLP